MTTTVAADDRIATDGQPPRPRWRRTMPIVVFVVAVALAGGGLALGAIGGDDVAAADPATAPPLRTALVQQRDLVSTTELEGTLTYADPTPIVAGRSGVVTWLPQIGDVIEPGETLFAIDGEPVTLLPGSLPQWRELSTDSSPGADVVALEQALDELGYAQDHELAVDEEYTSTTAAVVEVFRADVGLSDGDAIGLGEIVYASGPLRVAGLDARVGDRVNLGSPVLLGTAPERIVAVSLPATDQGVLATGDDAEVELPDGTSVSAEVVYVSPVAHAVTSGGQNPTTEYVVDAELTLAEGGQPWDEAPVTVIVADEVATDVMAVPVEALLALAEGGYAVEVVGDGATTWLLGVTIGSFEDGWVEVRGEGLEAGMEVVTA